MTDKPDGKNDVRRAFYAVVLHPIPKPTNEQVRLIHWYVPGLCQNTVQLRAAMQKGGIRHFGQLNEEQVERLSEKLRETGIPHDIKKTGDRV
ncbi:MAG TPA: hypothetical protein VG055_26220 [Planctomycetaceae bacterium]|jgi:hypothetical protein|nr:hypothetical protein [Planctomycetaceae bacterium]